MEDVNVRQAAACDDHGQDVGGFATLSSMDKTDLTIVGLQEIAVLLNVQPRTPHMWNYRGVLPQPDFPAVNGIKAWKRSTIIKWAAQCVPHRLPADLLEEGARWLPKEVDA